MKRYMLFCGEDYYPLRGMDDFVASFDNIDDAMKHLESLETSPLAPEWYQIYDIQKDMEVDTEKLKLVGDSGD